MRYLSLIAIVLSIFIARPAAAQVNSTCLPNAGATPSLVDSFSTLDLQRWTTTYSWGRRNPGARDSAYYPAVLPGLSYNRISVRPDGLQISAAPVPIWFRDRAGGAAYLSGLINSQPSFSQLYGYWEATLKIPAGKGLWPAFWMQTADGKPTEIDVMEILGNDTTMVYQTVWDADRHSHTISSHVTDASSDFHTYAVSWSVQLIQFYIDGHMTGAVPVKINAPMHLMINLQVGEPTSWPGAPDSSTHWPAMLTVRSVKVFPQNEHCGK